MNHIPTYTEQFNKLTEAYIKNEIHPYESCACFIGNLLNKTGDWVDARTSFCDMKQFHINGSLMEKEILKHAGGLYTPMEIVQMETLFCRTYQNGGSNEDSMFDAFVKTLEVLKQIHIEHGEVIDEVPVLKQRPSIPAELLRDRVEEKMDCETLIEKV